MWRDRKSGVKTRGWLYKTSSGSECLERCVTACQYRMQFIGRQQIGLQDSSRAIRCAELCENWRERVINYEFAYQLKACENNGVRPFKRVRWFPSIRMTNERESRPGWITANDTSINLRIGSIRFCVSDLFTQWKAFRLKLSKLSFPTCKWEKQRMEMPEPKTLNLNHFRAEPLASM